MEVKPKILFSSLDKQYTIRKPITISGPTPFIAKHFTKMILRSGKNGIQFKYSANGTKHFVFVNCKNTISANGENTTLIANKNSQVKTVEHILSALAGLGINACEIELIGSNQIPIPDTSSETFTNKLIEAGRTRVDSNMLSAKVVEDIYYTDNQGSFAILRPSNKLAISVLIQFPKPINEQYIKYTITPKTYIKELCWARSYIRRNCDNNVWKLCRKQIPSLPKDVNKSPVLVFNNDRWLIKPRKTTEPARHKLLDFLGDLTTLGYPIVADITIIRPGHEFNRKLVNYLDSLTPAKKL